MRIAVIIQHHEGQHPSPIPAEMVSLLRSWGCDVDVLLPDEQPTDLSATAPGRDLYVLKSGTPAALSLAGVLHAQGAPIINSYPTAVACRDKAVATRRMQLAGLPVPQTWMTTRPRALADLLADGPLIIKPADGSQGRDVRVARSVADLPAEIVARPPYLVQRYHQPDGLDRKLYCIAGDVFGVLRPWPARTQADKLGRPFAVSAELRDLVHAVGETFGMDLFGMDVVRSEGVPYVVDLSSFPGFKGVPEAALRLADYLYSVAAGARDGARPRHALATDGTGSSTAGSGLAVQGTEAVTT